MYPELKGKVAVVTGAGSNLGRVAAMTFAGEGAHVAMVDIDIKTAKKTAEDACAMGGAALPFAADVASAEAVSKVINDVISAFGKIEILVNCAGLPQFGRAFVADVDEKTFDQVMRVNVRGTWICMKHALPQMLKNGSGCIVNVSSAMGLVSEPGLSVYSASKHAVLGLTKAAALEYGPKGIRVNAVLPSRQETTMINPNRVIAKGDEKAATDAYMNPASGRAGRPEELASTILFLCSDGAANIHGASIAVDGGFTAK